MDRNDGGESGGAPFPRHSPRHFLSTDGVGEWMQARRASRRDPSRLHSVPRAA